MLRTSFIKDSTVRTRCLATSIRSNDVRYKLQKELLADPNWAYERAKRRNRQRLKEYDQAVIASRQYLQHRENVLKLLGKSDNIKALFTANDGPCKTDNYDEVCKRLGAEPLQYNDIEMRNTIMLVCTMLLENIMVEMKLNTLRGENGNNEEQNLTELMASLRSSDEFFSLYRYRTNFYHFKSSQFLNYSDSELGPEIDSNNVVKFLLCEYDDTEILNILDKVFKKYKLIISTIGTSTGTGTGTSTSTNADTAHINLAQQIINTLTAPHRCIPTVKIWAYLIDELGKVGLTNYQQIIYLSMFQYKHAPSVLAKPSEATNTITAPLMADHFLHLIQQDPNMLSTLLQYQVPRKDYGMFVELLSFLKLDRVAAETMVIKSPLFSRSSCKSPKVIPGSVLDITGLTISRGCMYLIMRSTIDIGLFEYLDLLFDKIVLHSMDKDNIELHYTQVVPVEGKVFDLELFLIMLDAALKSNDMGRLVWLLPFIDEYITDNKGQVPKVLRQKLFESLTVFKLEGKLKTYKSVFSKVEKPVASPSVS